MKKIGDFCTETPYTPTADVLLVFDTDSRYYSLAHDSFSYGTEPAFFNALGKSGAEYDSIYLHDIEKAELSRYRMVIFVNTCRTTNEKRDLIQDKLMGEGRHLMFLNADGYLDNDSRDTDNIGALTGISVKAVDIPNSAVTCGGSLPTAEIKPGWDNSVNFAVTDDAAEPTAYFCECDAVAGAKRTFDTHTVWYFSTFPADATVLRAIFKSAGVHIYTECGKACYAGNGIFMLTADEALDISVRLKNGVVINDHLDAMTTAIYASETGERLDIRYQNQKMEE